MSEHNIHLTEKPNIVLVHGLFMPGVVMIRLRNFFEKHGYNTTIFSYNTISEKPEKNALQLKKLLEVLGGNNVVIAHSLGGLLIQKTLSMMDHPAKYVQQVISLGTPWQGASILTFMNKYRLDSIVGKSLEILLPKDQNEWLFEDIALGSIAGKSLMGARLLFAPGKNVPTDGTVTIEETKIKGMTDHIVIPVSHTGLIFSNICATKSLQFIEKNHF